MSKSLFSTIYRSSVSRPSPRIANLFHSSAHLAVEIGDKIPEIPVYKDSPGDEYLISDLTASGKKLLVFVPGAFSPACSARHAPGYLKLASDFAGKNISGVYIIAGNDAFVTSAWAKSLSGTAPESTLVGFYADPSGALAKALALDFDASKFFGNHRSKRGAILINNGVVEKTWIEPDNTGVNVSEAENVLAQI
ncbi:thioredoxin-like protein [Lipomyces oligophaga]|uniref:thioredoxin-like protein n=1 Tax=Lipomyces oligophaga TaxID=45792 RepID=UPI0034CDF255